MCVGAFDQAGSVLSAQPTALLTVIDIPLLAKRGHCRTEPRPPRDSVGTGTT